MIGENVHCVIISSNS